MWNLLRASTTPKDESMRTPSNRRQCSRTKTWWAIGIVGAVIVAAGLAAGVGALSGRSEPPAASSSAPTAASLRRLIVSKTGDGVSTTPRSLRATVVSGNLPAQPVTATVLTDENCDPDEAGISHCINSLRMPDGSTTQVRHHHPMSTVACLTPGEHVTVETST
jgi:hypothetical protein